FNVLQGAAMRGSAAAIVHGTPAEGEFEAFNWAEVTIDVLLGLAFGGIVHLSPGARAQSAEAWSRLSEWAQALSPSQRDALAALRQAEHLNVDSTPGKPKGPADVEAHVNRARRAIEQLVRGEPVNVD